MSTFHAPTDTPKDHTFKVYDSRTRTSLVFDGGTFSTDDDHVMKLLRGTSGVTEERTKAELVQEAKSLGVSGAGGMRKPELEQAVEHAKPDDES